MSECVCVCVALFIQNAICILHTVICGLPRCIKFFRMCILNFSTTVIWYISQYKKNWAKHEQYVFVFHVKYPLFVSGFNENWIFLSSFSKNIQISNFMKMFRVAGELFHAERQKERHDEGNSRFSQFCERA